MKTPNTNKPRASLCLSLPHTKMHTLDHKGNGSRREVRPKDNEKRYILS